MATFELSALIKDRTKPHNFDIAIENPYFENIIMDQVMNRMLYYSIRDEQQKSVEDIALSMSEQLKYNPHTMYFKGLTAAYDYLNDEDRKCVYATQGHRIYPDNATLTLAAESCDYKKTKEH